MKDAPDNRAALARTMPRWSAMIDRFNQNPRESSVCLTAHASYLLRVGQLTFGVDLAFLDAAWRAQVLPRVQADFSGLRFMLLTHLHSDHFDPEMLRAISPWTELIVPAFMGEKAAKSLGNRVRTVRAGDRFELGNARVTVFDGLHHDDGGALGVDAVGYLIETPTLSLLFPGDVRDYRTQTLAHLPRADVAFAHVWLGRKNACNFPCEPYTTRFCAFWEELNPNHIVLTHLADDTRSPSDRWTAEHAALVRERLAQGCPGMRQSTLYAGDDLAL